MHVKAKKSNIHFTRENKKRTKCVTAFNEQSYSRKFINIDIGTINKDFVYFFKYLFSFHSILIYKDTVV